MHALSVLCQQWTLTRICMNCPFCTLPYKHAHAPLGSFYCPPNKPTVPYGVVCRGPLQCVTLAFCTCSPSTKPFIGQHRDILLSIKSLNNQHHPQPGSSKTQQTARSLLGAALPLVCLITQYIEWLSKSWIIQLYYGHHNTSGRLLSNCSLLAVLRK
jgi:hypothetical protein